MDNERLQHFSSSPKWGPDYFRRRWRLDLSDVKKTNFIGDVEKQGHFPRLQSILHNFEYFVCIVYNHSPQYVI